MKSLELQPPAPKKEIHNADFSFQQLSSRQFTYTTFVNCRFHQTYFDDADLTYANFRRCDLAGAHFAYAKLAHATFTDCTFANIQQAANFTAANLSYATFSGEQLVGVQFVDATLYKTNFTGANLRGANLEGAELTEVIFDDTSLDAAFQRPDQRSYVPIFKWGGFIALLVTIFFIWQIIYQT